MAVARWVVYGLAALLVAGGVLWGTSVWRFQATATRAEGTVIALEQRGSGSVPVVRFTGPDGAARIIKGSVASSPPAYDVGETVTVFYPAGAPDKAELGGFLDQWFPSALGIGIGVLLAGIMALVDRLIRGPSVKHGRPADPDGMWRWAYRFAVLVAAVLLLAFGVATTVRVEETARYVEAEGRVVALESGRTLRTGSALLYYPLVAYKAADGSEHRARSNTGSNPPAYAVGDPIRVFYDPEKPDDALIGGFLSRWMASFVLGPLALVFGGMAWGLRRLLQAAARGG